MGIFDVFLSEESRIQKNQRTLTNRDVQAEDREGAARWLADNRTPKALVALLTRFDMNLENQLKDKAEKDLVYALLLDLGDATVRPLERHLTMCKQIAHPIRMYVEMRGEQAATEKVFEILEHERNKDDFKPQKKVDMLVWLAERRHPGAIAAAIPMLEDFDEGVRYAAAEVILAQQDDAGRQPLEQVLKNAQEDSNRLRMRLAGVFATRRWPVDEPEVVGKYLPGGFTVRDARIVAA